LIDSRPKIEGRDRRDRRGERERDRERAERPKTIYKGRDTGGE
jgi:hypothetical protein